MRSDACRVAERCVCSEEVGVEEVRVWAFSRAHATVKKEPARAVAGTQRQRDRPEYVVLRLPRGELNSSVNCKKEK